MEKSRSRSRSRREASEFKFAVCMVLIVNAYRVLYVIRSDAACRCRGWRFVMQLLVRDKSGRSGLSVDCISTVYIEDWLLAIRVECRPATGDQG